MDRGKWEIRGEVRKWTDVPLQRGGKETDICPLTLPLIDDLIHQLKGAQYFTKLDVRWGYNNVHIREGDEWKATFRTNQGLFEPLVIYFGLTNSPATFQTMMNKIFQDLITEGVVSVHLNDILIFTSSIKEHRRITHLVLDRMHKHKLYL
jgi:hypothetical protein